MIQVCNIILFGSLILFFHTYLFYPIFVYCNFLFRKKNTAKLPFKDSELPWVSCLISVYNEEKIIKEKIISALDSNYPKDKLKFYIGSDASNDRSEEILQKLTAEFDNLNFYSYTVRRGKPQVLNDLMKECENYLSFGKDHIVLFTDANVIQIGRAHV